MQFLSKLFFPLQWLWKVLVSGVYRFYWDNGFSRASALAYTTLFAMVPVIVLMGNFAWGDEESIRRILEQILPPLEEAQLDDLKAQVLSTIEGFVKNAEKLTKVSGIVLIFTGIALLNTIESALNVVWRVSSRISIFTKVISFWAIITLGPVLVGISIIWTTKVAQLGVSELGAGEVLFNFFNLLVPMLAVWMALTLLYAKMPATKVRFRDAAFGAVVAAILFEMVKAGFAYYLVVSTAYSKIYGGLAAIPMFLLWLYVTWVVVLLGAEIAYQSGSIRILSGRKKYATDLGEIGAILGLRVLSLIGRNFLHGNPPPSEGEIAIDTGSDPELLRTCLDLLTDAKIITAPDPDTFSRSLVISPDRLKVEAILRTFLSKRERKSRRDEKDTEKKSEEPRQDTLLEMFRRVFSRKDCPSGPVSSWTLADFIENGG